MKGRVEMAIEEKVATRKIENFEPRHTFECGQCFRWSMEEDGSYTGVVHGKVLNISKHGEEIVFSNVDEADFENIWENYFDLKRDYSTIESSLSKIDETMIKAVSYGRGMRILNQDPWETLISFILSANNGVPRIKGIIKKLSESYGRELGEYRGNMRYAFPKAECLAGLSVSEIRACGTGYRDKYILESARMVAEDSSLLDKIGIMEITEARKALLNFPGVGPKVSDCILLFSMGRANAFPIDVWVKRVMEYFYLDEINTFGNIAGFADGYFGELKGFAQQYLFYYAREKNIGK
jgi:N-glycosylase/DNA lyase